MTLLQSLRCRETLNPVHTVTDRYPVYGCDDIAPAYAAMELAETHSESLSAEAREALAKILAAQGGK